MKYFWLAPKDQRFNNWIFYRESNESGVRLREEYSSLECPKCHKIDEIAAIELGVSPEVRIRSKSDYLLSDDGLVCVSTSAQKVFAEMSTDSVRLVPLSGDSRYSILLPTNFALTERGKAGMELHRVCPSCGRFRETCASPAVASLTLPDQETVIACPDIALENSRGRTFWFLVSEDATSALRAAKLSGLEYNRAY